MKPRESKPLLISAAYVLLSAGSGMAGEIRGKVTAQGMRSPENIVVYFDAIPGITFPAPSVHTVVDEKDLKFVPHVSVVVKGTTVDFHNSDSAGHNVFWPSVGGIKRLGHNIGTWPRGDTRSFTFNNLGSVPLLCNMHPQMSGYVVVVPTPYFALTDKEGRYEIKEVPPGKYTLKTWSEEGKPATQVVEVAGRTATVDLAIRR